MGQLDVASLRADFKEPHELLNASDGKTLFIRRWGGTKKSPVSVLIFHGITAYSGPYGQMIATQLSAAGFNVYAMDLRGHGLSDGKRGDYPSHERFIKDLCETVAYVKSKSRSLVVMGHSLGALSAIAAVGNCPKQIDGLIILSAAKKIRTGIYPKQKTSTLFKSLLGIAIFRGTPVLEYRRQGMVGTDDPLFNFKYSARFYSILYDVGALSILRMFRLGVIDSPNLTFNEKLNIPLLVGVGDHDELFATEFVKEFYDGIACDDKEFFVVPGGRHALFPKDGWDPLITWLNTRFRQS